MEASGTTPGDGGETQGGSPLLGLVLALALAFAAVVMVLQMADLGDSPRCDDPAGIEAERAETGDPEIECFDGSQAQKTISLVLGWPSGALAAIAAAFALYFAATGRQGQLLLRITGAAVVLGAASIVVGSI
jgi:hypothetical protein